MLRFGTKLLLIALPFVVAGCIYGFAGGGLPSHIKSVAVLPFENETPLSSLQNELYDQLRRDVEGRLGLHQASENRANAVVRGRIVRYDADIPIAYSSNPSQANTAQRKLQITVDVEIVDQSNGHILWSQKGLMREGSYSERAEREGRREAIQKIVSDVVAGAQSQW